MKIHHLAALIAGSAIIIQTASAESHPHSWELPAQAGDYAGERIAADGSTKPLYAQVIADEGGAYRVRLTPDLSTRTEPYQILPGETRFGSVILRPTVHFDSMEPVQITDYGVLLKATQWSGGIHDGLLTGYTAGAESSRFVLHPMGGKRYAAATLGLPPPVGAQVLFDGKSLDQFSGPKSAAPGWQLVEGAAMQVVPEKGGLISKLLMGDHRLHLEFRSSWMAAARGQARANSGVYLLGRYEVQVLDSYGLEGEWNECGGIYKVAKPLLNMCAPPTTWQSYDIDFTAPRFDPQGKKTSPARITVRHNGVIIHDNLELPAQTPGGLEDNEVTEGPLMLQNHGGDAVQFRNIWVLKKP